MYQISRPTEFARLVPLLLTIVACVTSCGRQSPSPALAATPPAPVAKPPTPSDPHTARGWPRWRGPTGDGVAIDGGLPNPWPKGALKPMWSAPLGSGWSSPVVADSRVLVSDREGAVERLLAFDAGTGKLVWKVEHPVDFDPHPVGRNHGNGPKSTPLASEGRVYCVGIAGTLECCEIATGKQIWSVSFPAEFGEHVKLPDQRAEVEGTERVIVPIGNGQGAPVPLFGYTGSPTMAGTLLITPVGGARGGTIVAFDKATGKVAWKSLDENVSYSSPIVAEVAGVPQIVAMTGPSVVGLDLQGKLLWRVPFQIEYDESISTPVVADGMVIVTATGAPLTAIRTEQTGGKWSAKVAWENRDLSSYLSSMVVRDGYVYGMNDGGEFVCVRASDGHTMWTGGSHGYYTTPVLAGDRLLALNERGVLAVVAATPDKFHQLGENKLTDEATWTSPALIGSRLYVRSKTKLLCFDLAK